MNNDYAIIIFITGTLILILFTFTLVIFLIVHKKKRYEHLLEKQQLENTYQNQLLQSKLEVQEQSLKYFSEEIHDNVGQLLSIAKMQLYNIRSSSSEQGIISMASECNSILGKAINDLRSISHTLNSTYISNVGIVEAIKQDLLYIQSAKNLECNLHLEGEEYELGNERELLIFRIIQEGISNAVKHGAPSVIDIYLNYGLDAFGVTITDNGSGFDLSNSQNDGIGLNNMHVRAKLLNGTLEINSVKKQGTTVQLAISRY